MTWHPFPRARRHVRRRRVEISAAISAEPLESRTLMTAVSAVLVNGADLNAPGAQRSVINTISIRFDTSVEGRVDADDLVLWNLDTRQSVNTAPPVVLSYDGPTNTATWAFPATSVPNGNYRATLKSMTVYDAAGNPLDGDKDGVGGDEFNFEFHRFLGDGDGDRDVDVRDHAHLRSVQRMGAAASPAQRATFDFDGDGDVDSADQLRLRRNLGNRLRPHAGNLPPESPVINEPTADGQLISAQDLHMQIEEPFVDPGAAPDPTGETRAATDWEVWTRDAVPERVFHVTNATQFDSRVHVHFGDGVFEGSHAGRGSLLPDRDYLLRVRHRDSSGDPATTDSNWDVRLFRTRPQQPSTSPGWVPVQAGYQVQEIPFIFPAGEQNWRLPVNIAFVPDSVRRDGPNDPLFYVTELYGQIRVVTNNYTVLTYASGLLNYNPSGPISGVGENGLTGLVVDPSNGDVFATMLYDDLADTSTNTFPKVTRFTSTDGGLHAVDTNTGEAGTQGVDILRMPGEAMRQSHIVSNISFGPDDKLYVHVGDGFEAATSQNDLRFKGKVLRLNRNGSAPTDNPHYDPADRGNDGRPDAEDYWFAKGLRNPFGGAWRSADGATPAQHFMVENGPSLDRLSMLVRDRNYLYTGSDASMQNFNIAYSPTGSFENGEPDWNPAPAPVNIDFVDANKFGGSTFPASKFRHAFITLSGATHSTGPQNNSKSIQEWVFDAAGNRAPSGTGQPDNPRDLIRYEGSGYATAAGIAAGPGGLFFSTLYPDTNADPSAPGAKILKVVYTGAADFSADVTSGDAPLTVRFTDLSDVPGATSHEWDFGDGTTSHEINPTHTYTANGSYTVKLRVTGPNGVAEMIKGDLILVGPPIPLPAEREPNDTLPSANNAANNAQPFAGPIFQLSLRGQINPGTDRDFFNLGAMQAGDVITAGLSGTGGRHGTLGNALVQLWRLNGGTPLQVASDNDSGPGPDARVRFTIAAADTYFAVADSNDDGTGTYELGLRLENTGAAPATGGDVRQESAGNNDAANTADNVSTSWRPVATRSTTAASIGTASDVDNFRFQFNAGDVVTVLADSTSTAQPRVRLRDTTGTILAEDDRSADGVTDSGVYAFAIPSTGVYYVDIRAAAGTGTYSLIVDASPAPAFAGAAAPTPESRGRIRPKALIDYVLGA